MSDSKKYLLVGLGNIGDEYVQTRHNVGFMVIDALAMQLKTEFQEKRFGAVTTAKLKGKEIVLLKPNTYMNLSGKAVSYWLKEEKIPLENLLVFSDDLHLPLGQIRLRASGSSGGQNGLKNIQDTLQTENYARLRIGIGGEFQKGKQVEYVLGVFTEKEKLDLKNVLDKSVAAAISFVLQGIVSTMNAFNKK